MLKRCAAIVIGHTVEDEAYLHRHATATGFGEVTVYGAEMPRARVIFFLLHFRVGEDQKRAVLADIRANPAIRFSPVVIVTGEYSNEDMGRYVRWGFDDVVVSPDDAPALKHCLESSLIGEQTYFETPTYFGPDRRRRERTLARKEESRQAKAPFERYRFLRDPLEGVRIVRRQLVDA